MALANAGHSHRVKRTATLPILYLIIVLAVTLLPTTPTRAQPTALRTPSGEQRAITVANPQYTVAAAPHSAPAQSPSNTINLAAQGGVQVDISAPETIRAGDYITYTYRYTNTTSTTASGVYIDATWSNFSFSNGGDWQFCPFAPDTPTNCDILPGNTSGPTVTRADNLTSGVRYTIGDLAPSQTGRFVVRLRTRNDIFPRSNDRINRPAGSAQLYTSTQTTASEDTTNTLIVGPLFLLSKQALTTTPIFPLQTGTFQLTLSNATGQGDSPGGVIRPDARPATNIVLRDRVPNGGEFVSATGSIQPVLDTTSNTLVWTIPGPLNPGQTITFTVTFKKLDTNADCGNLNNGELGVTSDEMPFRDALSRQIIGGNGAGIPVVTPMRVDYFHIEPGEVVYGTDAQISIRVLNYYDKPIVGAKFTYDLQSNIFYIPSSASPAPSQAPDGTQLGGHLEWLFNMPAAPSKDAPVEQIFTLRVRASYSRNNNGGATQLIPPTGVPSACNGQQGASFGLAWRVSVKKYTDAQIGTFHDGAFWVKKDDEFPYIIEVTNRGITDVIGLRVDDLLPNEVGADFSYIVTSGRLNDVPHEPDLVTNGNGGLLSWNLPRIPANSKVTLRYKLKITGRDYYNYCNSVSATVSDEEINFQDRRVCVKINPQIDMTKTISKDSSRPGEEVQFTLTLTNRESTPYRVGIVDLMDQFIFVRQVSGYGDPTVDAGNQRIIWPLTTLDPGQQVSVVFIAKTPDRCENRNYDNRAIFRNETDFIFPQPEVKATLSVGCNILSYNKTANQNEVGLTDRVIYGLNLNNKNPVDPLTNIQVVDILPPGFSYIGLEGTSNIRAEPTQTITSGNRIQLTWVVDSIPKNSQVSIRYFARTSNVVGLQENLMQVKATNTILQCEGQCATRDGVLYSIFAVTVKALITVEQSLPDTSCANPGDIRGYRLTLVNTNNRDYTDTTVAVTLPIGLEYVGVIGDTSPPTLSQAPTGETVVNWSGIRIPTPQGTPFSQVNLEINLRVGEVWGNLSIGATAKTPDGSIPPKDANVGNPTVPICAQTPGVSLAVGRRSLRPEDEPVYILSFVNTTNTPLIIDLDVVFTGTSTIAADFFKGMIVEDQFNLPPEPTVQGTGSNRILHWTGINIPAAQGQGVPTFRTYKFRTRFETVGVYGAHIQVNSVSPTTTLQERDKDIEVEVFGFRRYIPLARR